MLPRIFFALVFSLLWAQVMSKKSHKRVEKVLKSADGLDIYATAVGNPHYPPIVLLHGGAMSIVCWDKLLQSNDLLSKHYLVRR